MHNIVLLLCIDCFSLILCWTRVIIGVCVCARSGVCVCARSLAPTCACPSPPLTGELLEPCFVLLDLNGCVPKGLGGCAIATCQEERVLRTPP